jgi:hypothetical protein
MRLFIAVILLIVVPMTLREMAVSAAASESAGKAPFTIQIPHTYGTGSMTLYSSAKIQRVPNTARIRSILYSG